MTEVRDPRWGAPSDQSDVARPFRAWPSDLAKRWGRGSNRAVPMKHRPLGQAAFSACVADGLRDVEPGDLVLDSRGRWCLVWNDALDVLSRRD